MMAWAFSAFRCGLFCYAVVLSSISLYFQVMLTSIHDYDYTKECHRGGLTDLAMLILYWFDLILI